MLDQKNRELLELLRGNAREAVSSLARKLGLSRTAVYERLAKLESSGVIEGYSIKTNPEFELRNITAIVMLEVDPKFNKQVVSALHRLKAITRLQAISGSFDFTATVQAATTEEIDSALDQIGEIEGISRTQSSIVLSTKFDR